MAQSQVQDPKASAFINKVRSWIPAFNGTAQQPPAPAAATPVAGGGGGNGAGNGNAGGGGGNGNNGNPPEPFFGRKEKQVLLYAVLFFASIPAVIYANKMVLEMTRMPPAATAPASPQAAAVPSTSNVLRSIGSFDCSTPEKKQQGFAHAEVNQLTAGSTLQVANGCAIILANNGATKLDAHKYQLVVLDEAKPGWSFKCGDVNGNSNTLAQCAQFIQEHAGRPLWVIVHSDGEVRISA